MNDRINALLWALTALSFSVGEVAYGELKDDVSVQLTSSQPRIDAAKRRFVVAGQLSNDSNVAVSAPISLAIDGFNPANLSVTMQDSDGVLPDGQPYKVVFPQGELASGAQADFEFYLEFSNPMSSGVVAALEKVAQKAFKSPVATDARFSFNYHLLRIPAGNHQPIADAGVDRVGAVGAAVVLDGSFSADADGDPISFAWNLNVKPQGSLAQLTNAETANPSLVADIPGVYQVNLMVSDGYVLSQTKTVNILIDPVSGENQRPKIISIPPDAWTATTNLSYQVRAGDPDGDYLQYRLVTAPSGMTINAKGMVLWQVADTPHKMIPVTIEVDDGRGGVTQQKFSIHIMPCVCS